MGRWLAVAVVVLVGCGPAPVKLDLSVSRVGAGSTLVMFPEPLEAYDLELHQVEGCPGLVMARAATGVNVLFYAPDLVSCSGTNAARVLVSGYRR